MESLRRFFTWALGGLAVGVAARAFTRTRRQPETAGTAPVPAPTTTPTPLAPLATTRRDDPIEALTARVHTGMAIGRVLIARLKAHTTTVIAGSLAYYALLAVFPAAIAAISIYGLVADPADLTALIESLAERLPDTTARVISDELLQIVTADDAGLGIATAIGIAAALWSASAGVKILITGVNLAYGERETRPYWLLRGLALTLTLGIISGLVVVVAGVAVLPTLVDHALTDLIRWPALFVFVVAGLAALYRIAPSDALGRNHPIWQGALAAALFWLAATAAFSAAVTAFGRFSATYGALAGVVVLLIWFFLSGLIVLLGAEFNAVIETRRQRPAIATD